jgi:hypothetical protein
VEHALSGGLDRGRGGGSVAGHVTASAGRGRAGTG